MTRTVGEVMTDEVVEARPDTSFKEPARLLDRHRISGVPVVDHDDKVVGVVSGADLIRRRASRSGHARTTTVDDLMSAPAVTVHPEQRVADAARVMERHRVDRLPVADEEDRLIGIATRRDLLRVFLRTDEEIRLDVIDGVLTRAMRLPADAAAVSVRDGMVTLEGQLERRGDIPFAIRLTWRVDGVVGVVNKLAFRTDDTHPLEPHPRMRWPARPSDVPEGLPARG
ncbi:CBS domain-containing protein [Streptomyces atrovirens]|uniref:CBS domain-containing protein n=1 Tax=Streptomyces atrovirens TaxID=285556 RepID=A0ABW0DX19_9ACTN